MGIGPAVAFPTAVKAAVLEVNDIDLFEISDLIVSNVLMQFRMYHNLLQ